MRIEISYKFIIGFLVVVVSGLVVNLAVPYLQIAPEFQQIFTVACSLVVGLIIGAVFSRMFTANIRRLTSAGDQISRGDLSEDIQLRTSRFPDETSDLAISMNHIQESLRTLVGDIRGIAFKIASSAQNLSSTSQQMSSSAHDVARTVDQISKGAETQAEMVEESNRLFKDVAISINLVATAAGKVAESANQTVETAKSGSELAGASLASIRQVLAEAESSSQQMFNFIGQLQRISKFVEVINGIAQKTNLLALNATIEAARAGEYGRGFAVVAEEIRKLADSTTTSADEITALVEAIRAEGQLVQSSMGQVIEEMESGRSAVDRTNQAFSMITQNAEITRSKSSSIAELAEQQISSAEQISRAIDEIDKVVSDNAAATEQVSAATQEQSASMQELAQSAMGLSTLSESMLEVVKQFKLAREEPGL
ncbi:MAG: HAMP domain-containing methyl-accepting chemotaxis protein [Desulfuromonadales bacterium]|nr:HAMP domain-containing methyl-accepting chemotaxis protein [Desulfuromonadales bacterium]